MHVLKIVASLNCILNVTTFCVALQAKLNEEKAARQKAELNYQEKERQMSMLTVDYRQIQQRLQKLEGEHRQEVDKASIWITFLLV